ncbi:hypothetical protein DFQ28_005133 [Apophysomyces sp. BC1034]|nr:hypothetical protein DFQ28_005133 [Apophysomyces sp. BC1034]
MLEKLGVFVPCGHTHVTKYPHLIETSAQVIDFSVLRCGSKRPRDTRTAISNSNYALYSAYHIRSPLPGDPDEIPYKQTAKSTWKRMPNDAQALEEELYVIGPVVVWSRGYHVLKTIKHEAEQLQLACFAWFPFKRIDTDKRKASPTYATLSLQGDLDNAVLRKALCVVLSNAVRFHFSDGTSYYVPLPFFVQRICALDVGILLEYERKTDDGRYTDDSFLSQKQTNYASIRHLRGEAEPVIVNSDTIISHRSSFSQDQEIVFATSVSSQQRWTKSLKDLQTTAFIAHDISGKELICIMNPQRQQLKVLDTEKLISNEKDAQIFELTAISAIPICATRIGMNDILFIADDKLMLCINGAMNPLPISLPAQVTSPMELKDSVHHRFSVVCADGRVWRLALNGTPRSGLVRDCLAAVNCALPFHSFTIFQAHFTDNLLKQPLNATRTESEWESFVFTLLSFLPVRKNSETMDVDSCPKGTTYTLLAKSMEIGEYDADITKHLDTLIRNLHVIYEDYRLAKLRQSLLRKLGTFLLLICAMLGKETWIAYYVSHGLIRDSLLPYIIACDEVDQFRDPPDIRFLLRCIYQEKRKNAKIEDVFAIEKIEPAGGITDNLYGYNVKMVWCIYQAMYGNMNDLGKIIELIAAHGYRQDAIRRLIPEVATPLLNILEQLRLEPPIGLSQEAYSMLGKYEELRHDMHTIFSEESTDSTSKPAYGASDLLDSSTEKMRFGYDGVLAAVRFALNSERMPELKIPEGLELSNIDLTAERQTRLLHLCQRTLSMSVGRGIFSYGTFIPDIAKPFPIEMMTLSARLPAEKTVVSLDEATLHADYLDWPKFHNGVAAGLRLSPGCTIDGAWIYSCRPTEADPQHAGFLLALGLNGNLRQLSPARRYEYLAHPLCELEKTGFLLGEAVAYRRTKSSSVTKVLSVDIPALASPHTMSLQHSSIIKATSLLSMGLVYLESNDRRMVEVMLQEIGRHANQDPLTSSSNYESCALAAGFALGFITLGDGEQSCSLADLSLRGKLYYFMTGMPFVSPRLNLDVTSPGATIALGLMYLKTEDAQMAARINILDTRPYLNYVRPDFLLLRVVAKNLIMWNTIRPTEEWVSEQLPEFMRHHLHNDDDTSRVWDIEASKQAEYNIVTGSCLCIGLRYAGSKDMQAFKYLLFRLDMFMKLSNVAPVGFQAHITKNALRTGVDVIATAAAMVMAGTGNLELLERLKQLHRRVNGTDNYGNHMATHMAMGLLFAGVGGYTLNTSNEGIAGLLCALYPFYPTTTSDNRYHVQAWRHLWILALATRK